MEAIPQWLTSITIGCSIGVLFAGRVCYFRPIGKKPEYILEVFSGGFCLGLISSLGFFDVYCYFSPGELVTYTSDYKISYPGPFTGKFSRCEAGLWINDVHTHRSIQLCTSRSELYTQRMHTSDAVKVTARVNKFGSYIIKYTFITK